MVFALMASAALMLVVLWQRSPLLSAALVGPLLAIALYQRSTYRALRAMRLALTDPLTGLGNHRHFHDRLERELIEAERNGDSFSLCLVDVDDFKRVNDLFGHPAGDRVLSRLATTLRQNGEAFRLGGDEFALLLPEYDESEAVADRRARSSSGSRSLGLEHDRLGHRLGRRRDVPAAGARSRRADPPRGQRALLGQGEREEPRARVPARRRRARRAAGSSRPGPDRAARFRAAASLAKAVDLRDTYTGSHSARVADLAARVAARLGLDQEQIELARLAGSLHDLGKLAIPEEILRKPGPLTGPERLVLERHPQIGFRMLDSLGIEPVADWILHHHERWDGRGYPDRLPGTEIPLGARIIFVVDAYDAMTSDRVYRGRLTQAEALAELERCAGTQFDPAVVAALAEELELEAEEPARARRGRLVVPGPPESAHIRHARVTHACAFPGYDRSGEEVVGTGPRRRSMAAEDDAPRG